MNNLEDIQKTMEKITQNPEFKKEIQTLQKTETKNIVEEFSNDIINSILVSSIILIIGIYLSFKFEEHGSLIIKISVLLSFIIPMFM